MTSRVSHTTFDCHDSYRLSEWWKQVVAYDDIPDDPNDEGDEECMISDRASGHKLLFIEVADDKTAKNRIHLDLVPTDGCRDEEVERVLALGARMVVDLRNADGSGWVVLADPEDNEFCILRSDAERDPSPS